jgi:hypothetical protein
VPLRQSTALKLGSRFLLYIAIAIGALALCALLVAIAVYSGHTHGLPVAWFGFIGFTPLIFWTVIKSLKRHWKQPAFWFAVGGLFILHSLAFVATLLHYPRWPLLLFIPTSMVEAGLFVLVLGKLFDDSKPDM